MIILLKNKHTLKIDDFNFKCCIGKKGLTSKKIEGDKKTPKGFFELGNLYYRSDRISKPVTSIKCIQIKKDMGWCDDINYLKKYNKPIKINNKIRHEKLKRRDHKYDLLLPIKYNFKNPKVGMGSCIFLHLTKDYKPTLGCIALKKKDFIILLRLIKKQTKIKII
tara:strand:- start:325 stop:819 length:495 start_codon:yes stop_codon:yes gene_type:complete